MSKSFFSAVAQGASTCAKATVDRMADRPPPIQYGRADLLMAQAIMCPDPKVETTQIIYRSIDELSNGNFNNSVRVGRTFDRRGRSGQAGRSAPARFNWLLMN